MPAATCSGSYCATCHGTGAKGDGPLAEMLKKRPADLTLFARNNNGIYPADMVGRIIDGRQPLAGHGGKDMPTWGDAFKESGGGSDEVAVKAPASTRWCGTSSRFR